MEEYIPTVLRKNFRALPRYEEKWAVGIDDKQGGYGMIHGPFATELEALEIVGQDSSAIIHFLKDGSHKIAWLWDDDRWKKIDPEQ